jgi:hypothetical protein
MWALVQIVSRHVNGTTWPDSPVPYVAAVLVALGGLMLIEAIRVLVIPVERPPAAQPAAALAK